MKKCCVLIPYFNAGESLVRSIDSIDLVNGGPDVVVVDDGSQKVTAASVLEGYKGSLLVHLIELPANVGIERALNAGLDWCLGRYTYIARLDCGDRCKGQRIEKQIRYLDDHLECMMVGAWASYVDMSGKELFSLKPSTSYESIKHEIFLNSTFVHPAVMFRSDVFEHVGRYPTDYPAAEDYALFFEIVKRFPVSNIPELLLDYEVDSDSISSTKRRLQISSRIAIILRNFNFSAYAFYGLFRSLVLYFSPRRFTLFLNGIRFGLIRYLS